MYSVTKRAFSLASKVPLLPSATQLFINGKYVDGRAPTIPIIDPRNGEQITEFQAASTADVDAAVKAARIAFDEGPWPRMSGKERGKILMKVAELIEQKSEYLAQLETLDNGKPIFFSRVADIPLSAEHFRYFSGWADKIEGTTFSHDQAFGKHFGYTIEEPIGVAAQIVPWNFPLLMAAWKMGPALATGCCVVLKPSEKTPMTAVALGEIFQEAGVPDGVVNIIPGYGDTGAYLAAHGGVDKVAFTGSHPTALKIQANLGIKPFTTELGGKSPIIIMDDCDVETAAQLSTWALFFNHGQCCCAGSRVFVHENIYDRYIEETVKLVEARKLGDPFTEVDQGPQVDKLQFDRIMGYINRAKAGGVPLATGGEQFGTEGFYVKPTIFHDVPDDAEMFRDEIFGPVMGVAKFSNEDDVVRRANNSTFGLAAGVFSNNVHTTNRLSRRLKAGTIWINCYNVFDDNAPFGGYKQSGVGREKGKGALSNYLQTKTVVQPLAGEVGWYR